MAYYNAARRWPATGGCATPSSYRNGRSPDRRHVQPQRRINAARREGRRDKLGLVRRPPVIACAGRTRRVIIGSWDNNQMTAPGRAPQPREGDDEPHRGTKEDDPRRLSRLDARCVRLLSADVPAQGHRQGIRRRRAGGRLRPVPDARDAIRRRLHLRPPRRPMGTQASADAGHPLLFDPRRARRLLAELLGVPGAARVVRHRHGR